MITSITSYNRLVGITALARAGGTVTDVTALAARVTELEADLAALEARVTILEAVVISLQSQIDAIIANPTPVQRFTGNPNTLGLVGSYDWQPGVNTDGEQFHWNAPTGEWFG